MKRPTTETAPHGFARKGWRFWICRHCYAPRALHPRKGWVRARPLHDNQHLSVNASHFEEGW
ncbi:hypothetical protein [Streptomyces canus]|uniref:hypothetical protein n=1 Tax=Streptomyces canus TaxID=58343 RepID=UPI0033AB2303